jgi:hypothetical protein
LESGLFRDALSKKAVRFFIFVLLPSAAAFGTFTHHRDERFARVLDWNFFRERVVLTGIFYELHVLVGVK